MRVLQSCPLDHLIVTRAASCCMYVRAIIAGGQQDASARIQMDSEFLCLSLFPIYLWLLLSMLDGGEGGRGEVK